TSSGPAPSAAADQTNATGGTADGDTRDAPVAASKGKKQVAAGNAVLAVAPGAPAALSALTGKGLPLAAIDGRP
ncbi:MAG: hypothetical protein EOQ59_31830, partial [Mesorhizobium sp.]